MYLWSLSWNPPVDQAGIKGVCVLKPPGFWIEVFKINTSALNSVYHALNLSQSA